MNGPDPLERGYRRLLALFPAAHRREHEEEMLGVLMTGAHAGQHRPGLAESANLISGALRIGLRPGSHGSPDPRWRDALAAVSVVLPLLCLLYFAVHDLLALTSLPLSLGFATFLWWDVPTLGSWLVLTVLVLLRLRRTAALAAAAMLILHAVYAISIVSGLNWTYTDPQWMLIFVAFGLEIAALVTSPGPRQGLRILTWKHYAFAVVVAATLGSLPGWLWLSHPAVSDAATITVIAASLAAMMAAFPLSRRVAVLLSVLAYYVIVGVVVLPSMVGGPYENVSGWVGPLRITLTCLPFAIVIACLAIMALRSGRRPHARDSQAASTP